jgi:monoamine oxidase
MGDRLPVTRRRFLNLVGRAGGTAALYSTMQTLGLVHASAHAAEPPGLARRNGRSVLILGAGIAGMTAAYELSRAGYQCTILEARSRAGGRNWTVRRGDVVEEIGSPTQRCEFERGQYLNMGPARIPHHHRALLGYCKRFGVELEVFNNANRSALLYNHESGALQDVRVSHRAALADTHGYTSELLAKAVNQNALDDVLSPEDRERLLDFLSGFGALDNDFVYRGSGRRGYSQPPGAADRPGVTESPYSLDADIRNAASEFLEPDRVDA